MPRKPIDLTGKQFGKLVVLNEAGRDKHQQVLWLCKCECGNTKVIRGNELKKGDTKSCGCFRKEKMKKRCEDEECRKRQSEIMKKVNEEKWKDEEYRQRRIIAAKKLNEEQWKDNERRFAIIRQMKERWQDEDFKKMQSEKMKERAKRLWQDEDFKKMQSERMKERWQDEEMKWKMGYKGGITPISIHLRNLNGQWFEDCKKQANYTCQLTGKCGCNLHTHHLKAFSTIVLDAHNLHNIKVKDQVKNYTDEELQLLEEYVASWHKDNSNGIVLSEDVHKLFHSLYGKGDNTPEQFEEFRQRYMAKEFNNILK